MNYCCSFIFVYIQFQVFGHCVNFFGQQGHRPTPPPPPTKSEGARTLTQRNKKRLTWHISLNEQGKSLYADKSATIYNNSSSKSLSQDDTDKTDIVLISCFSKGGLSRIGVIYDKSSIPSPPLLLVHHRSLLTFFRHIVFL